jgi:hypothetical protein
MRTLALVLLATATGCDRIGDLVGNLIEDAGPVGPQPAIPIPRPPDAPAAPPGPPGLPPPKQAEAPPGLPSPPPKHVEQLPRVLESVPATAVLDAKHYGARLSNDSGLYVALNPKLIYKASQEGDYVIKGGTTALDMQKTQQRLTALIMKRGLKPGGMDHLNEMVSPTGREVMFAAQDAAHHVKQVGFLLGKSVSLSGRSGLWLFLLDDGTVYQPGGGETIRLNGGKGENRDVRFDAPASVVYVDETSRLEVASLDPSRSYRITVKLDGPPALIGVATPGNPGDAIHASGNATVVRAQLVFAAGESYLQGVSRVWFSIPAVGGEDSGRAVVDVRRKEDPRPSASVLAFKHEGAKHR